MFSYTGRLLTQCDNAEAGEDAAGWGNRKDCGPENGVAVPHPRTIFPSSALH